MHKKTFACVLVLTFSITVGSLRGQEKKAAAPEADTTSLIPTAIKDYEITLEHASRAFPVRVQYTVQGTTLFILPVWTAGNLVRVVEGTREPLQPDHRVLPADEKRLVRLNVEVRNLLDSPELEKVIVERLRQRVVEQLGHDTNDKFRIERPNISSSGIRFTLIGSGRGDDSSPAEIALGNPVARPADGVLSFTLDPTAVRKIEQDRALVAGLTAAGLQVLPTGPMKVRFERLEMDAQIGYLRTALDDFRKRVGSALDPSSGLAPDVIVSLRGGGTAETRNHLRSMLVQSLQVTVSTRQGATELPLMPLLEKAVDSLLATSKLDGENDQQRVTFLMDKQVTLSATLGEVKRLGKLDEKARGEAFQLANDHYNATQRGEASQYAGSMHVGFQMMDLGFVRGGDTRAGIDASYANASNERREQRAKEELALQKQGFDKLMREFAGKMPTLAGITVTDETLAASAKRAEANFQQNSFFVDYTLHRFQPLPLIGAVDAATTLGDMLQRYALLKADHEALLQLLGAPRQLAEAKANMEKLDALTTDLRKKVDATETALQTFEKDSQALLAKLDREALAKLQQKVNENETALQNFEKNSQALLAKLDREALVQLQKDLVKLKRKVGSFDFASNTEAFDDLLDNERPPALDCTGPTGADAQTVRAAQVAWAKYLGETNPTKSFPLTKDRSVLIDMVLLPPGKYYRGSPDGMGAPNEHPQRIITLTKPLWVGKYEVTQAQYRAVTGKNPSDLAKTGNDAARFPVENVTHNDCVAFCRQVSLVTGRDYRLLHEAEWEYAYRAGTRTRYYHGDNPNQLGDFAEYEGNNNRAPAPVGGKKPNAFGLFDMAGNVSEWCDNRNGDYDTKTTDPHGPVIRTWTGVCGGSFWSSDLLCRATYPISLSPGEHSRRCGFRLARVAGN